MPLKFIDKFAKKYSIFSTQANYARSLLAAGRMKQGTVSYADGNRDVELATAIDLFPFAMEVFKKEGDLVGRAV